MIPLSLPIATLARERNADAFAVIGAALVLLGAYAALAAAAHPFYKTTKRNALMQGSGAFIALIGAFMAFAAAIEWFGFAPGFPGIAERVVIGGATLGLSLIIGIPFVVRLKKKRPRRKHERESELQQQHDNSAIAGLITRAMFGLMLLSDVLRVAFYVVFVSFAAQKRRDERPRKEYVDGTDSPRFPESV